MLLANALEIEELYTKGKCYERCPYYASRKASSFAQLVVLPYQCIFSKDSRESLNIDLKNNILIVDEAHNLINSIESSNSVKITIDQMNITKLCIDTFVNFNKDAEYQLLMHIAQLHMIVHALIDFTQSPEDKSPNDCS
ncbi:hypothetical protein MXB_1319, partial [Myxobolus squamalis]